MKFKIGDRVEVVKENPWWLVAAVGNCGEVRAVDESDNLNYFVDFPDGRHLWMKEEWLKLKEDKMDLNAKLAEAKKLLAEVEAAVGKKEELDLGRFYLEQENGLLTLRYRLKNSLNYVIFEIFKSGTFHRIGYMDKEYIPLKLDSEGRIVEA